MLLYFTPPPLTLPKDFTEIPTPNPICAHMFTTFQYDERKVHSTDTKLLTANITPPPHRTPTLRAPYPSVQHYHPLPPPPPKPLSLYLLFTAHVQTPMECSDVERSVISLYAVALITLHMQNDGIVVNVRTQITVNCPV